MVRPAGTATNWAKPVPAEPLSTASLRGRQGACLDVGSGRAIRKLRVCRQNVGSETHSTAGGASSAMAIPQAASIESSREALAGEVARRSETCPRRSTIRAARRAPARAPRSRSRRARRRSLADQVVPDQASPESRSERRCAALAKRTSSTAPASFSRSTTSARVAGVDLGPFQAVG